VTATPPARSPVLTGRHVVLEPLSTGHIDDLVVAATEHRPASDFMYIPATPDEVKRHVTLVSNRKDRIPFAQRRTTDQRIVGCTSLIKPTFWRGRPAPDEVELGGTWLDRTAQRTPINTEAKLLMLAHGFDRWRVHRVSLMTDARNQRSRNAIMRLGARFDGILRAARPASDGVIRDTAAFSILEAEWPTIRTNLEARLRQ
jgi:RimJ/RimL family protein N-acetyltransferase